ncbi:hypothetical protein [Saprospira grandis]|uniref:hypothetical protein n=1 Tax=Saprospira grandis TaxID=1008 RepID=UPI0022DE44C9|nr:hypothetical protein [Saprospira grandis]WBM73375.1 hypothetical protein OP864_10235 [Saprospira grandis]
MNAKTWQWAAVTIAILSFIGLIALGRTTPNKKKVDGQDPETDSLAYTDDVLMAGARAALDSSQLAYMNSLEQELKKAQDPEQEILRLKLLSRTWNEYKNFGAGGFYAEKVAQLSPDAEAWNIAGSTYSIAFNKEKADVKLKQFLARKAISAFEKAIELAPDSVNYAINEALMYIDLAMVDASVMPMTGAQKLLALDKKFPNNLKLQMQMGRLSLNRTGDIKKAIPRFENVVALAKNEEVSETLLLEAHFSLVECYKKEEKPEKVLEHYDACIELAKNRPDLAIELKKGKQNYENNRK